MLHYPQQKAPSRYRRKAAVAFEPAQGRPCLSQVKRSKGHSFYRVRPSGNRLGSYHWRQFLLCVLLMGFGPRKRKRIWQSADGVDEARKQGKSGVCMLGSKKQKAWLSDQAFAKKFGFEVVDTTEYGYELLAVSFDKTVPKFAKNAKSQGIESKELTIYYDMQCPYVDQTIRAIKQYCETNDVPVSFMQVDTLQKAKELPCVFNNWAVFYQGKFETVNLLDLEALKRILKKGR